MNTSQYVLLEVRIGKFQQGLACDLKDLLLRLRTDDAVHLPGLRAERGLALGRPGAGGLARLRQPLLPLLRCLRLRLVEQRLALLLETGILLGQRLALLPCLRLLCGGVRQFIGDPLLARIDWPAG